MPIHNITAHDHGDGRFPQLGVLRKGARKLDERKPGSDLGEMLRFVGVDPDIDADWKATFGDELVDELDVLLPYATIDENWAAWREAYGTGSLKYRCDGINHVLWQDAQGDYHTDPKPCPGAPVCQAKPGGRLEIIVPRLGRLGTITLLTTSIHDIKNLDGALRAVALRLGTLQMLPLRLTRVKRLISMPLTEKKNGKEVRVGRTRSAKWLLHLEPSPEWVRHMLATQSRLPGQLPGTTDMRALAPPDDDPNAADIDTETGEIIDAVAVGARDLDVADPGGNDDIEPAAMPVTVPTPDPDHWTPEIAACKTCDEVLALLPRLAEIEPLSRREHTVRIAYARIVHLASAALDNLDWTKPAAVERRLAAAAIKLDPLPPNTPGWNLAMDKLIAARDRLAEGAGASPAKAAA